MKWPELIIHLKVSIYIHTHFKCFIAKCDIYIDRYLTIILYEFRSLKKCVITFEKQLCMKIRVQIYRVDIPGKIVSRIIAENILLFRILKFNNMLCLQYLDIPIFYLLIFLFLSIITFNRGFTVQVSSNTKH